MSTWTIPNANAALKYSGGIIGLKVTGISYDFDLAAQDSQGATYRGFYPRLRGQGSFTLTAEFNGYREYQKFFYFAQAYGALLKVVDQPPLVYALVPSRKFTRAGILISGMDTDDHVGSMVFKRDIQFISVYNPDDPVTTVVPTSLSSAFTRGSLDPGTSDYFYPVTSDATIFDRSASASRSVLDFIHGQTNGSTGVRGESIG